MSGITFTSKIKNEAALYKNLEDIELAAKSARKKALLKIAEKAKDKAKENLIAHNTIRTGALLNSIKISEKGLENSTPYVAVYADYPDMTLVNKDRKTPITNKQFYYAFQCKRRYIAMYR